MMRQGTVPYRPQRGGQRGGVPPPPDLPSLLLDSRIVFIGMPLVASVAELVVSELLWLQYADPKKPVYMYINSLGSQQDMQAIAFETETYAILDTMHVRPLATSCCHVPPSAVSSIVTACCTAVAILDTMHVRPPLLQQHAATSSLSSTPCTSAPLPHHAAMCPPLLQQHAAPSSRSSTPCHVRPPLL